MAQCVPPFFFKSMAISLAERRCDSGEPRRSWPCTRTPRRSSFSPAATSRPERLRHGDCWKWDPAVRGFRGGPKVAKRKYKSKKGSPFSMGHSRHNLKRITPRIAPMAGFSKLSGKCTSSRRCLSGSAIYRPCVRLPVPTAPVGCRHPESALVLPSVLV